MDLRLQMVFEAVDRATGPVNRIAQALQAPGRAISGALSAATGTLNQLAGSFGTVAGAIGGGIAVRDVIKDNDAFQRMEILSGQSKEAVDRLRNGIYQTAIAWRVQTSEVKAAVGAMRQHGASLDFITGNLSNVGAAVQLLGGHGEELGRTIASMQQHLHITTPDDTLRGLALLREQLKGVAEGFDIFAKGAPLLLKDYKALKTGVSGNDALRDVGLAFAVVAKGTKAPREAISNTGQLLGFVQSVDNAWALEGWGVKTFARDDQGRVDHNRRRPLAEFLPDFLKAYHKNQYAFDERFGSQLGPLRMLINDLDANGENKDLARLLGAKGDAQKLIDDATKVSKSWEGAMNLLQATLQAMASLHFADPLERLADLLARYAEYVAPAVAALGGLFILSVIVNQVGQATMFLVGLTRVLGIVTAAQWLFNVALTANPIGLVVVGIAALIAAAVALYVYWEPFRAYWQGLWNDVRSAFETGFVTGVVQVLAMFTPLPLIAKGMEALVQYFRGFSLKAEGSAMIDSLWEGFKEKLDAMTGWVMQQVERLRALLAQLPGMGAKPTYGADLRAAIEQQRQTPPLAFGPGGPAAAGQPPRAELGGQLTVRFENAPPGTRLDATDLPPTMRLDTDLGYGFGPN